MSKTKSTTDGGPAFPSHDDGGGAYAPEHIDGMSLRDYFAAWAMHAELVTAGALTGPRDAFIAGMNEHGHTAEEHLAFCAYRSADAMLKGRAK